MRFFFKTGNFLAVEIHFDTGLGLLGAERFDHYSYLIRTKYCLTENLERENPALLQPGSVVYILEYDQP